MFQCPCGTAATRRWPRGHRPRRRVMFVLKPLSSRKTRRAGFRPGWMRRHSVRASATSARSCSAACCDFFERPAQAVQAVPQRAHADADAAGFQQPAPQLAQRGVGFGAQMRQQCRLVTSQHDSTPCPAPWARPCLTRGRAPLQRLVNIRDADAKQRRNLAHAQPAIHRGQHPITQVLRVGLPSSPRHQRLQLQCRRVMNHIRSPCRNPQNDSDRGEGALNRRSAYWPRCCAAGSLAPRWMRVCSANAGDVVR
jgi:hypothetical protein